MADCLLTLSVTQVAASLKKLYNLGVHLSGLPQVKLPSSHSKQLSHVVLYTLLPPPSFLLFQHQMKITMDSLKEKAPQFLIQQGTIETLYEHTRYTPVKVFKLVGYIGHGP